MVVSINNRMLDSFIFFVFRISWLVESSVKWRRFRLSPFKDGNNSNGNTFYFEFILYKIQYIQFSLVQLIFIAIWPPSIICSRAFSLCLSCCFVRLFALFSLLLLPMVTGAFLFIIVINAVYVHDRFIFAFILVHFVRSLIAALHSFGILDFFFQLDFAAFCCILFKICRVRAHLMSFFLFFYCANVVNDLLYVLSTD